MKKKLTNILLILVSAFAFTSCGEPKDTKEALVDDMISLLEESATAMTSGDKELMAKIEEKSKALDERAKALGIDPKDPSTIPADLQKKMEEAGKKMMKEAMDKALEGAGKK